MSAALQYLEAAKIEDLASQLRAEGYEVVVHPSGPDEGYDLVAMKGERRIAIEVKARGKLTETAEEIRKLREKSIRQGYDEFRLIVVNPPREASIEIDGLESKLLEYLENNLPDELVSLSPRTDLKDVSNIEIDSVEVTIGGIRVAGSGIVEVELEHGSGEAQNGMSWYSDFPLRFDVFLSGVNPSDETRS